MIMKTIGLVAAVALAGCTNDLQERVSVSHGAQFFSANCAQCHGAEGRGYDGPTRDWTPPPDLTLLTQRNRGMFPEIQTLSTIYGPAFRRNHGRIMPEFGERDLGPMVIVEVEEGVGTPIPADLIALSEYLRSIQR